MQEPPALRHLYRLLDETGLAQHARYSLVAREFGYCLDDNARGLALTAILRRLRLHLPGVDVLFERTAAFVQHAWNADGHRFRNFMGYDRRWLDNVGSEDSHGRAVFALGLTARDTHDQDVRRWAQELLDRAVPALPQFTSPRALACGLLGLAACQTADGANDWSDLRARIANRLCAHLRDSRRPDWVWFEDGLSYENGRMCEALLACAQVDAREDWLSAGLDTLRWLCSTQTTASGTFTPIGNHGFWSRGGSRAQFDQQPIEAAATVSAALQAWRVTDDAFWLGEAERAHAWFLGANDLGRPLVLLATGGCRDGLHPDRVNANQGAESTLAWLQADLELYEARLSE